MSGAACFEADYTWRNGHFESGVRLYVDNAGRLIDPPPSETISITRLRNRAILPGFVSAHSHAFQRGLRGRGEHFPTGAGSFWTWRNEMYTLVRELDGQSFDRLCRRTFQEMLCSGITAVGEFHYLHHVDPATHDFAFDRRILRVAAEVGIRMVLLGSFYRFGGFGQPLAEGQARFSTPRVTDFIQHMHALASALQGDLQSLGLAPHSVRAVDPQDLAALDEAARQRGWPLHMHLEEQPREIEECLATHGVRPVDLVLRTISPGRHFTAVHATHTPANDLHRLLDTGARVCVCPLTEANLGDGLPDGPALNQNRRLVCVGTDSNARLDFVEELRWLEYGARLRTQSRGVYRDDSGACAARLLECGTTNGAAALGLESGELKIGRNADFFAIDLSHPALADATPDNLLDAFLFGAGADVVREVVVGGRMLR